MPTSFEKFGSLGSRLVPVVAFVETKDENDYDDEYDATRQTLQTAFL
jgi:hypothetical protein